LPVCEQAVREKPFEYHQAALIEAPQTGLAKNRLGHTISQVWSECGRKSERLESLFCGNAKKAPHAKHR